VQWSPIPRPHIRPPPPRPAPALDRSPLFHHDPARANMCPRRRDPRAG